jgi:Cu+-exporting ATPase
MTEAERKPMEKLNLKIGGMQCSFCVDSIHKVLGRMKGVGEVAVSLSHEEALVRYDPEEAAPAEIEDTLKSMGYTVRDPRKIFSFEEEEAEVRRHKNLLAGTAVFMAASLGLMTPMWLGVRQPWFKWAMLALALGMVFGVGRSILKMVLAALRRGILNQHVLMEFGAFGGLAGAAVFITAYHVLSMYVSTVVRTKSSRAIRKLMDLRPATARVVRDG